MKVTDEEKRIIRILKKELKKAEAYEKLERSELIAKFNQHIYYYEDVWKYLDAAAAYYAISGTYYDYVDEIVTRIRLWARNSK